MVDAHNALTKRHKASLQTFIDKNDWIQGKIYYLESDALPAVDAQGVELDNAAISTKLDEHDRMDAEVQELDNGELKALRLLAKVLFSVDKLLHLLRVRGKTLRLLQLKNKWKASLRKAESDCTAILNESLPTLVKKARWKEPSDSARDEIQEGRLATHCSPASGTPTPMSCHTTPTNSIMARQMRAEVLSLDLAALTSRVHTLMHSTLAASGKIMDAMVDISPSRLPESLLDIQDDIEARIKQSLAGLVDFCHLLARQWRHVDEAYWVCRHLRHISATLRSDIEEATLKSPSETLAEAFQVRMNDAQSTYDSLVATAIAALPKPLLASQLADQAVYNEQVASQLSHTIQTTSEALEACRQAVNAYRKAAQALAAAQAYHRRIIESITDIRQQMKSLTIIRLEVAMVASADVDLQVNKKQIKRLYEVAGHALNELCAEANGIIGNLLNAGIDPNVRRSLQDSLAALRNSSTQALTLTSQEEGKIAVLQGLRDILESITLNQESFTELENTLSSSIEGALRADSEEGLSEIADFGVQAPEMRHRASELSAACSTAQASLDGFDDSLLEGLPPLRAYVQREITNLMERNKTVNGFLGLLARALKQRKEVGSAKEGAVQLECGINQLLVDLASSKLDTVDLQDLHMQYEQLINEFQAYKQSLVSDISFLSGSAASGKFNLNLHDRSVRLVLNQESAQLESRLNYASSRIELLRTAVEASRTLQQALEQMSAVINQIKAVKADHRCDIVERLSKLHLVQAAHQAFLSAASGKESILSEYAGFQHIPQDLQALQALLDTQNQTVHRELELALRETEVKILCEQARLVERSRGEEDVLNAPPRPATEVALMASFEQSHGLDDPHATPSADLPNDLSIHTIHRDQNPRVLLKSASVNAGNQDCLDPRTTERYIRVNGPVNGTDGTCARPHATGVCEDPSRASRPYGQYIRPNAGEEDKATQESDESKELVLETFAKAATAAGDAISQTMDALDGWVEGEDASKALRASLDQAKRAVRDVENSARPLDLDTHVQKRLFRLQTTWSEVQDHAESLSNLDTTATNNRSASCASIKCDVAATSLRSSSPDSVASITTADQKANGPSLASTTSTSRLPVIASRVRKESTSNAPSGTASPLLSKLPRPTSVNSNGLRTPTAASTARKAASAKKYNALSPTEGPRYPSAASFRTSTPRTCRDTHLPLQDGTNRRPRSSVDRSSIHDAKTNKYEAKPDHKLDMAVGRIVNDMPVPVTITAADVQNDEVGKYWIGDPPKLYYARILRSRTVMVRVGGGWQELGSFLSDHFDQLFSAGDSFDLTLSVDGDMGHPRTPTLGRQAGTRGLAPGSYPSPRRVSQGFSSARSNTFTSPRSMSAHVSPLKQSHRGGGVPFDLTALLVKSTSRSPPAAVRPGTSHRNRSAPVPWKT